MFTNLRLLAVVVGSGLVQLTIRHLPVTQSFFQMGALSLEDCAASLLLGLVPVTVIETAKLVRRAAGRTN